MFDFPLTRVFLWLYLQAHIIRGMTQMSTGEIPVKSKSYAANLRAILVDTRLL